MKGLYLINPLSPSPSYLGGNIYEHYGLPQAVMIADLATVTVAAMAPDGFPVRVCEEQCQTVDLAPDEDYVGLTGKVNQWPRAMELARHFRSIGKKVILGGSFASLSSDTVRPYADILVRGELEPIANEFFADLVSGETQPEYQGAPADFSVPVQPRWDLYPLDRASMGSVQTSRGCPFECEFCDVIVYAGRKQRHKPIEHVLAELDDLYGRGLRQIYLADDNLTVYRRHATELMTALRDWNHSRPDGAVHFATQLSVDLAREPALLALCADAGLSTVFLGIETPEKASLKEAKKRQNLVDLEAAIEMFSRHGIAVQAGIIAGFDNDDAGTFQRIAEFASRTPVGCYTVGLLVAPEGTPLYARMAAAGRLLDTGHETIASPLMTNIVPAGMTPDELTCGIKWLCNELYDPKTFGARLVRHIELFGESHMPDVPAGAGTGGPPRAVDDLSAAVLGKIPLMGPAEGAMVRKVIGAARKKPGAWPAVAWQLFLYMHARSMFDQAETWGQRAVAAS